MLRSFARGFRRWMVSGLELARMIEEFKGNISSAEDHHHYGRNMASRVHLLKVLFLLLEDMGNPFN